MVDLSHERIAALEELGRKLSERRLGRGLSLRTVAGYAEIAPAYLGILEKGENPKTGRPSRPSATVVQNLARALDMDVSQLLVLAGYPAITPDGQARTVAMTLGEGRVPTIFEDLRDIENNFLEYIEGAGVVEAPVFAALSYFDKIDDVNRGRIRIVGRTFRARTEPGILYTLDYPYLDTVDAEFNAAVNEFENDQQLTSDIKITVLGTAMTPTIMLLRYLRGRGIPYSVENREGGREFLSPPDTWTSGDVTRPHAVVRVVYSDGGQLDLLRYTIAHMALVVDPFRLILDDEGIVRKGFRRVVKAGDTFVDAKGQDTDSPTHDLPRVPISLWRYFRATELPMNLVCTTTELLQTRRHLVVERLQTLRADHRALREQERDQALGHLRGDGPLDDTLDAPRVEPVVIPFNSPYIYHSNVIADTNDVQDLAKSLQHLAELGKDVGFLVHARSPNWYLRCIEPGEKLDPIKPQAGNDAQVLQMRGGRS